MEPSVSIAFSPAGPFHFQAPKEFDDNDNQQIEELSVKLKAYFSSMHTAFKMAMDDVGENTDLEVIEAYFNDVDGDRAKSGDFSSQLQYILIMACTGLAFTALCRATAKICFESRRQLVQRCNILSKARAVGRLPKILKPSFWDNHFEDSLATWEGDILKYDQETTALSGWRHGG